MTKRLENPEKRVEPNERSLVSMTKRLENPEKRAEHNRYVLQKYKSDKGNFISVTIDYFFQISEGPTYVCSCCGCLHFRKNVVILTRARLDSMGNQTFIDQVCYVSLLIHIFQFHREILILYSFILSMVTCALRVMNLKMTSVLNPFNFSAYLIEILLGLVLSFS